MAEKLYLIKVGEISLKGGNRPLFEKRLRGNIKDKLHQYHPRVEKQKGRLYLKIDESVDDSIVGQALSTTFGITGFARAYEIEKDMDVLDSLVREILPLSSFSSGKGSFKVESRREDKSFSLSSYDISCHLADIIHLMYPDLTVDLKNPDHVLHVEVRKKIFVYTSDQKGPGGLPVQSAGRGMLLLSGGIDSPVAAFHMAKRGMKLDCIYFHAYPYTSELALEKVKTLASLIAPYLGGTRLYVVPFTDGQLRIKKEAFEDETTLMFRAAMMRTAEEIAKERKASAIVTGEALSQVASQTLEAMSFTDSMTDLLVLRPLVGMDKEEIIETAKSIGTYETSILPYEDCCVIFSPKHPITHPVKQVAKRHYESLKMEEEIEKAVKNMTVCYFNPMGEEEEKPVMDKSEESSSLQNML